MPGRYGTDVTRVCHFPSSSVSGCYRFATEMHQAAEPRLATACWGHERSLALALARWELQGCPTRGAYFGKWLQSLRLVEKITGGKQLVINQGATSHVMPATLTLGH